jgi:Flp pilus assembly protein TadG
MRSSRRTSPPGDRRASALPSDGRRSALSGDRQGSAALQFALVALPFLMFLLFLAELGYDFFAQVSLDSGVQAAGRQVQIGAAQSAATVEAFKTSYLCPALNGLLPCASVSVDIRPVMTDYHAELTGKLPVNSSGKVDASAFGYCPGKPKQLMLVQAIYTSPSIVGLLVPSMSASTATGLVHVTLSTTGFINENFPITSASPAGC